MRIVLLVLFSTVRKFRIVETSFCSPEQTTVMPAGEMDTSIKTNYRKQLQDLNWRQASQKIGNFNTIAALTYHINYYMAGILAAFETGNSPSATNSVLTFPLSRKNKTGRTS